MYIVLSSSETKAPSISDLTIVNNDFKCICCQHLQQELETVLLELKTAKKIIELLQKQTDSTMPSTTANTQGRNTIDNSSDGKIDLEKNTSGNWKKVNHTRQKYKQPDAQHPQPIPTTVNRFALPDNHQEKSEASHSAGLVEKTATAKIKNKCISEPQRNKILIIGDSHARGCAAELSSLLDTAFEVMGAVMPSSRLQHYHAFSSARSHLYHNDFL